MVGWLSDPRALMLEDFFVSFHEGLKEGLHWVVLLGIYTSLYAMIGSRTERSRHCTRADIRTVFLIEQLYRRIAEDFDPTLHLLVISVRC